MPDKLILAVFDFDGTITNRETFRRFLWFCLGKRLILLTLLACPRLICYGLGLHSRKAMKEFFIRSAFKGMTESDLQKRAKSFAEKKIPNWIRPEALKRIHWHKEQGHVLLINSASPDVYITPWAKSVGFSDVISSKIAVSAAGLVIGHLEGDNCWGEEKVQRLKKWIAEKQPAEIYAYGDT